MMFSKRQLLENECKQYFRENNFSYESYHSLAVKIGRAEDELSEILDGLVTESFLKARGEGNERIFSLNMEVEHQDNLPHNKMDQDIKEKVSLLHELTNREKEVLLFMMDGLNNIDIAEEMKISKHTVKNHISNIFYKLDIKDRLQLFKRIYENN
jgi:DNA-binding NarL/FixJ family response regulator